MSYVNFASVDSDGSSTDTLVTAAFVTSGSNRHIDVPICLATPSARTVSSVTRPGDTYTKQRDDINPSGSTWVYGEFWMSTTEPGTGSQALTVVISASLANWGFSAVILDDVSQSSRLRGGTVTLNPDGAGTVANLVLTSETDPSDLVVSSFFCNAGTFPTAPTGGTETLRGSWISDVTAAGLVATAPGASSVTLGWNGSPFRFVHYAASHPPGASGPTNTVPDDTGGIYTTSSALLPIPGMSVAKGGNDIISVTISVPAGKGLWLFDQITPVDISGNANNSVVLSGSSVDSDYNLVLATAQFQGAAGVHETITATMTTTDGIDTDITTFDLLNDVRSLIVAADTFAHLQAAMPDLYVKLDDGAIEATLRSYVEDAGGLFDTQFLTVKLAAGTINILSHGGQQIVYATILSGETYVTTISAVAENETALTYSIVSLGSGGLDDSDLFTIGSFTGVLEFVTAPTYGVFTDADQDGVYLVSVQITNGTIYTSQDFYITVIREVLNDINVYISYDNTGGAVFFEVTDLVKVGSLKWEDELHTRSQASFTLISESSSEVFYRPSIGATIVLSNVNTVIWAGTIERIQEWQETKLHTVLFQDVEVVSWAQLFDRYLVAKAFDNKTLREIIDDISSDELSALSLNIDNVQMGPLIEKAVWNYQNVTEVFNDLARITGYSWWVAPGQGNLKVLYFVASGTREAPFILSSRNQITSLSVTRERSDYRNVQYVRAGNDVTDLRIESFKGDGENRTFTLAFPVAEITSITIDDVASTFGIRGVEEEGTKDFYYQINNTGINQDLDGTVLTSSEVLKVTYRGYFPLLVIIQDDEEITSRIGIEGGDGRYQNVEDQQDINTAAGAYDYGNGLLRQKGIIPETIQFATRINGLASGQILKVNLPWANLSGDYLISKVSIEIEETEPPTFFYNVEAISGEALGGWAEFWSKLARAGRKFTIRENEVSGPLKYYTEPLEIAESFSASSNAAPWAVVSFASSTGDIYEIGWSQIWES